MKKQMKSYKIMRALVTLTVFLGSLFIFNIKSYAAETDVLANLMAMASETGNNLLVVGDETSPVSYTGIMDAVYAATDGDIIVIYPGEYNETLDIRNKDISLIGLDKTSCIIKYDTSVYSTPVLNGAAGVFCNLTFYGYRPKDSEVTRSNPEEIITPDNLDEHFSGYVIHIDDDYEYGRTITFNNCNIISENNNCIGLGMRDHFNVSFNNCYIRSAGEAGILYVHDPDSVFYAGTDMHLSFRDNIWENYGYPYVIFTKSMNYANRIELTFQNVTTFCYASSAEKIYLENNASNTPDLRYVASGLLTSQTPIHIIDNANFSESIKSLRSGSASGFAGIYFICENSNSNANTGAKIVTPFYVINPFDLPGEGFAGSCTFHLSNDSFGNTLEEMNVLR